MLWGEPRGCGQPIWKAVAGPVRAFIGARLQGMVGSGVHLSQDGPLVAAIFPCGNHAGGVIPLARFRAAPWRCVSGAPSSPMSRAAWASCHVVAAAGRVGYKGPLPGPR